MKWLLVIWLNGYPGMSYAGEFDTFRACMIGGAQIAEKRGLRSVDYVCMKKGD